MLRLHLLIYVCIYTAVNITIEAFSIQEFNMLVNYPMWKSLTEQTFSKNLIFKGIDLNCNQQRFLLETLYPNDSYGSIITESNVADRAWQFHLLLSVYYAIELMPILNVLFDIWNFCQDPITMQQKSYYNSILFRPIYILNLEIKRMQKSLLYFSEMLNTFYNIKIQLTNGIYDTLDIVENLTVNGQLPNEYVISKIEVARKNIKTFFFNHIEVTGSQVQFGNTSTISPFLDMILEIQNKQQNKRRPILEQFQLNIFQLVQSNNKFGLQFDPIKVSVNVGLPAEDSWMPSFENLSIN